MNGLASNPVLLAVVYRGIVPLGLSLMGAVYFIFRT